MAPVPLQQGWDPWRAGRHLSGTPVTHPCSPHLAVAAPVLQCRIMGYQDLRKNPLRNEQDSRLCTTMRTTWLLFENRQETNKALTWGLAFRQNLQCAMPTKISCTTVNLAHFSPTFCQSLAEAFRDSPEPTASSGQPGSGRQMCRQTACPCGRHGGCGPCQGAANAFAPLKPRHCQSVAKKHIHNRANKGYRQHAGKRNCEKRQGNHKDYPLDRKSPQIESTNC